MKAKQILDQLAHVARTAIAETESDYAKTFNELNESSSQWDKWDVAFLAGCEYATRGMAALLLGRLETLLGLTEVENADD